MLAASLKDRPLLLLLHRPMLYSLIPRAFYLAGLWRTHACFSYVFDSTDWSACAVVSYDSTRRLQRGTEQGGTLSCLILRFACVCKERECDETRMPKITTLSNSRSLLKRAAAAARGSPQGTRSAPDTTYMLSPYTHTAQTKNLKTLSGPKRTTIRREYYWSPGSGILARGPAKTAASSSSARECSPFFGASRGPECFFAR